MNKLVVTELIQENLNEQQLKVELDKLLNNAQHRKHVLDDYEQLWHLLGDMPASATAAKEIIALLK